MTDQQIFDKIKSIMLGRFDELEFIKQPITTQSLLTADLGLDSLDKVELVMDCEKEFNVVFRYDEVEVDTIQDLIDVIKSKI